MRYLGGKARIGKKIAVILDDYINRNNADYYEPCVGGGWVTSYLQTKGPKYLSDINEDLILLWQALQKGYIPPEYISEEEYKAAKSLEPSAYRGFVGFACSWGGKWFGGYARGEGRNWASEGSRSLQKKIVKINNAIFQHKSIYDIRPKNAVIYIDPPYFGTTEYKDKFDHNVFWPYIREISQDNKVFVSEYIAPDDFKCVAAFNTKTDLNVRGDQKEPRIERLFTI